MPDAFPFGLFIKRIEQTKTSDESGGENIFTVELTDHSRHQFKVLNGVKGDTGDAASIKEITASIDNGIGTPSVTVTATGTGAEKTVHFDFKNLKGEKGDITLTEDVKDYIDNRLAAVKMPLNPVCAYDMADVQSKTIFQHGYFESTGKYDTRLCDLSAYKGKTIQVTVSGYRKGEGGYPSLYIYDINWKWVWNTSFKFNRTSELTLKTTLTIPTAYNTIWCTLYHFPENKMNNTIVMTNLTIELLDERPLIDSSGSGNHAIAAGGVAKVNDNTVGTALNFNKGCLLRGKNLTAAVDNITISLPAVNGGNWNFRRTDIISLCKKGFTYTVEADFKVISGNPQKATVYYYDFTARRSLKWSETPVVNGSCRVSLTFTHNPENGHDVQLLVYSGQEGHTSNIASKYTNFSLIEYTPTIPCIGVGKQWSHSRWIKMNGDAQDKTVNPRLWRYGAIDYCYTDIAANSGVMQSIYIVTYKTNSEAIVIAIPKVNIADDKWHNLIVCNDVQSTYARKIVYLDGKLIEDTTVNGDFTGLINDQNVDMSAGNAYVKGSLANLLFFDRLLTALEAQWLSHNPYYPAKRYSLAEYKADENRKLLEELKKRIPTP